MARKRTHTQITGFFAGIIFLILLLMIPVAPDNPEASRTAAVAAMMALWWMTEALPLGVTSFLPVILFPLLGIMKGDAAASEYMNSTVFLFLGGFIIAAAMEKWDLHKRVALVIIRAIGGGASGLILGFMVASAFLSMFISNTATAIMMLPVGMSVILEMENKYGKDKVHKLSVGLLLGIAYASSIGGIATLVGTQPNLVFAQIFRVTFPGGPEITYGKWLFLGFPMAVVMLIITWLICTKLLFRTKGDIKISRSVVRNELAALGNMSYQEKLISVIFALTGLLWMFRAELDIGFITIPGWSTLFGHPKFINDGTVAMAMALFLFIIPARHGEKGPAILNVKVINRLPWEIILLFGGGFALAKGFHVSGLSEIIGSQFSGMSGVHPLLMIFAVSTVIIFLTELTSNTATTQTILPILASIAVGLHVNPMMLMIPATLTASFAFMLPVATPPNAIVFSTGNIRIGEMVRAGIILNIIGIIVTSLIFYFLGDAVFGIDPFTFPSWAV